MEKKSLKRIKTGSLILFLLYVGIVFMAAQETPRKYNALRATQALNIDGKADELSWKNAAWSADFIDIEGVIKPSYKTQMKMLWDDTYLYFFAQMEEPHVWGTLKQRDTVIFYNNDFEIFIDPDGDTHNYMEFEMNVLNTVWDLFLTKPYRNHGKVLNSWDIQGLKTAVHIDGTLNDSKDTDIGWSVEIAIPWAVLTQASNSTALPENEFWRINFSRVNWQYDLKEGSYSRKKDKSGKYLPEYNWVWSPQGVINLHEPEHWGYVYFSTKESGSSDDFEIPQDDYIKWYMYSLYRKLLQAEDTFEKVKKEVQATSKMILGEEIKVEVDGHNTGWSIVTKSPFTQKIIVIKEDGKFLSYEK